MFIVSKLYVVSTNIILHKNDRYTTAHMHPVHPVFCNQYITSFAAPLLFLIGATYDKPHKSSSQMKNTMILVCITLLTMIVLIILPVL